MAKLNNGDDLAFSALPPILDLHEYLGHCDLGSWAFFQQIGRLDAEDGDHASHGRSRCRRIVTGGRGVLGRVRNCSIFELLFHDSLSDQSIGKDVDVLEIAIGYLETRCLQFDNVIGDRRSQQGLWGRDLVLLWGRRSSATRSSGLQSRDIEG